MFVLSAIITAKIRVIGDKLADDGMVRKDRRKYWRTRRAPMPLLRKV